MIRSRALPLTSTLRVATSPMVLKSSQHGSRDRNDSPVAASGAKRHGIVRMFAINATWSLVGVGASRAVVLAASVLLARMLGPVEFGRLGAASGTAALFTALGALGLGLAATKHVAQYRRSDRAKAAAVVVTSMRGALVCAVVLCLVGVAGGRAVARGAFADESLAVTVQLAVVWAACGSVLPVQTSILAGLERFRAIAGLNIVRGVSTAVFQVIGAHWYGSNGAVAGAALAEIASAFAGYCVVSRRCEEEGLRTGPGAFAGVIPVLLRFGLASWIGGLATTPALWLCRVWVVRGPGGLHDMGVFEAANKYALSLLLLPSAAGVVQLPLLSRLAEGDGAAFRRVRRLHLSIIAGTTVLPAAGMAVCAGSLMGLAGPEYGSGGNVLAVLAAASIASAFNTSFGQSLISKGHVRVRLVADVGLALIMVAAGWMVIPSHGALGFAIAQLLAYGSVVCLLGLLEARAQSAAQVTPPGEMSRVTQ